MVVKMVYHAIVVVASATALAEAAQVAGSGRGKHRPFSLVITEYNNNPKNMWEAVSEQHFTALWDTYLRWALSLIYGYCDLNTRRHGYTVYYRLIQDKALSAAK